MAVFYNQATLTYRGGATNSNVTTGEINAAVTVSKYAVSAGYEPGDTVTYVVNIVNGGSALANLTVTDDLGAYTFEGNTVYPLEYVSGSVLVFVNGVRQPDPDGSEGPPPMITGLDVPAGANVTIIYEASVTPFAPLGEDAEITNTVTVTGGCLGTTITASATVSADNEPELTISKSLCPAVVTGGGEITYTFVIQNSGSAPATAEDDVVVTDDFTPALEDITVTLDGETLMAPTDYTYNRRTGVFTTGSGVITVPAATFSQNEDGVWVTTPGVTVLTVTGTI